MSLNDHPYFAVYLVGCLCVIVLTILKVIYFQLLSWFRKENILTKNLKKVAEPDDASFWRKTAMYLSLILFEAALSWINVLVILWQILHQTFSYIREVFTTVPEEIKSLRFPLYNNPDMSRESIWAYSFALGMKAGSSQVNENDIFDSLDLLHSYYPFFDPITALNELKNLKVVSSSIIDSTITRVSSTKNDEWTPRKATPQQEKEDEKAFWEYKQKEKDIDDKYDPQGEWDEFTTLPDEYLNERRNLNNEYRVMLRRRNEWTAADFDD